MNRLSGRRMLRRIPQLLIGLFSCGIGISLMVRGAIGAAPWDVLAQGISRQVPLTFGVVTLLISLLVLLLWIPLRQRPGIGTVLNALLVGPFADVGFLLIPEPGALWMQIAFFALGLLMMSAGTGLYIGAAFGPGPRDGLMTGLYQRTGWPIWTVRTGIEVAVVAIGWALGGIVGAGTVAFALLVGPLCQFFMRVFAVRLPADGAPGRDDVSTGEIRVAS